MESEAFDFLAELRSSLQALAQPAETQLRLYPDGVVKADELALDFEHWRLCALGRHGCEMSADQRRTLDALDQLLAAMSGVSNAGHWTEDALWTDPAWMQVRELAAQALTAFGWPNPSPLPT